MTIRREEYDERADEKYSYSEAEGFHKVLCKECEEYDEFEELDSAEQYMRSVDPEDFDWCEYESRRLYEDEMRRTPEQEAEAAKFEQEFHEALCREFEEREAREKTELAELQRKYEEMYEKMYEGKEDCFLELHNHETVRLLSQKIRTESIEPVNIHPVKLKLCLFGDE